MFKGSLIKHLILISYVEMIKRSNVNRPQMCKYGVLPNMDGVTNE